MSNLPDVPEIRGITPQEAREKLNGYAEELDALSTNLADLERAMEPVQDEYEKFMADFEIGCWERHVNSEGEKLPAKGLREQMARNAMDPALLGRHVALSRSRERMMKRISALGKLVEAQRSILSALKEELSATR